jgi:hypothetical protein
MVPGLFGRVERVNRISLAETSRALTALPNLAERSVSKYWVDLTTADLRGCLRTVALLQLPPSGGPPPVGPTMINRGIIAEALGFSGGRLVLCCRAGGRDVVRA